MFVDLFDVFEMIKHILMEILISHSGVFANDVGLVGNVGLKPFYWTGAAVSAAGRTVSLLSSEVLSC